MQIKEKLIFEHVGDTWIATPAVADKDGFNSMMVLDEVGHEVVEMLMTETTVDQIVDRLLEDYDADRPTIQQYVEHTIEQLSGLL